jgi:all-trans-retinol dehydrogenase (NAD+)
MNEYGYNPFKKSLEGEHIFLTGAGSGIGQDMAIKLGKMGCKMSISNTNPAKMAVTVQMMRDAGVPEMNINAFTCDVSDLSSYIQGAEIAQRKFGDVTILINNAGIVAGNKGLTELSKEEIEMTLKVNTMSIFYGIKQFLPSMIKNKKGHIITISSFGGIVGIPGLADYNASKFGAFAIDESLRYEMYKKGHSKYIKTTVVMPYVIDTGMFEGTGNTTVGFNLLKTDETVNRIIYAIQQEETDVIIPYRGNILHVNRLLPTWLSDRVSDFLGSNRAMDDFVGRGSGLQNK